jgi:SAM-dependent methyltransferase
VAGRTREPPIGAAYDASEVTFRILRAFGWGPLLNFGYFPLPPPFTLLNFLPFVVTPVVSSPLHNLATAQLRLVHRSIGLLAAREHDRVLDVGCGRGLSSFLLASAFPGTQVIGVDLVSSSLQVARTLYGSTRNLAFVHGDAAALAFPDRAFARVLCLEAGFQFPDRHAVLREMHRVLAPGGRAVLVDFMWAGDGDSAIRDPDVDMVRRIWRFDTLASVAEYRRMAGGLHLDVTAYHDWTGNVLAPLHAISDWVAWLGDRTWGRTLLRQYNPVLASVGDADWREFVRSVGAHLRVGARTRYVAMVLTRAR